MDTGPGHSGFIHPHVVLPWGRKGLSESFLELLSPSTTHRVAEIADIYVPSSGDQDQVVRGPCSPLSLQVRVLPTFHSFWELPSVLRILGCGHITPASLSLLTWPSLSLCLLSPVRTAVAVVGWVRWRMRKAQGCGPL